MRRITLMYHTKILTVSFLVLLCIVSIGAAQNLDGNPYKPGVDANIDMFMGSWKESMPQHTHGNLVERDILTKGDPLNPPTKGAVLKYTNRFTFATLEDGASIMPTTLSGEQEILFLLSGEGTITGGGKTYDIHAGSAVLIPAGLEFTMKNSSDVPMTMYLINEPVPRGFRPNDYLMVKDENVIPVASDTGHWCHVVKALFSTTDGLGTLQAILTVGFPPKRIAHPHSHQAGCEEAWTTICGEKNVAFIGKQLRMQPPGTGYMIPPDGKTPHANINTTTEPFKMLYFARYGDHDVRP